MVERPTVVFVCTGNTCRSPLAMALAQVCWPASVAVLSAGLQACPGDPAAAASREVAAERGADLEDHHSRSLDRDLVRDAGWLIGMTRSHVAQINNHLDAATGDRVGLDIRVGLSIRVGLMGAPGVDLRGRATPDAEEVSDPFGGDTERYRATADQLDRLIAAWTSHIVDDEPKADS